MTRESAVNCGFRDNEEGCQIRVNRITHLRALSARINNDKTITSARPTRSVIRFTGGSELSTHTFERAGSSKLGIRESKHWWGLSNDDNYDTTITSRRPNRRLVWRRRAGSNRCIAVLQTAPLPLGYGASEERYYNRFFFVNTTQDPSNVC